MISWLLCSLGLRVRTGRYQGSNGRVRLVLGGQRHRSGFTVLASVLVFGALFGFIGAIIGVPIAAGIQIVVDELTAARRGRIAAADAAAEQPA